MKEYKEQKLKEFEEKFIGEDVDVVNGDYRKEFYSTPENVSEWVSQLIDDTYTKAIEDAIKICDEILKYNDDVDWAKATAIIKIRLQQLKVNQLH